MINVLLLYSVYNFIETNSIYNTYLNVKFDDDVFSVIIMKNDQKLIDLLKHLPKCLKIKENDPILEETCSICYEKFDTGEYKRILPKCNHFFHKKCIDKWFRNNICEMNCPLCRTNYNNVIHYNLDESCLCDVEVDVDIDNTKEKTDDIDPNVDINIEEKL
jgi:hypothetical protein